MSICMANENEILANSFEQSLGFLCLSKIEKSINHHYVMYLARKIDFH